MATEKVEVLVGKKAEKEPAADKTAKSSAKKPKEEVGGRAWVTRLLTCWNCGGVTWIDYDTNRYHAYTCGICGATNVV
jgi:hypothetical protein